MTDNIQKLYEVAGVEEKRGVELTADPISEEPKFNEHYVSYGYPPFTAEKQIEIIKFLISKHARFDMFKNYEQKDLYMVYYECRYFPKQYLPFGEALAESINYLWQDLTEEQKQEIKRILQ